MCVCVCVCVCVCQIFAIFHIFLSLKMESKKASGGLWISGSDKMADAEGKGKHLHRHVALMWRKEPGAETSVLSLQGP